MLLWDLQDEVRCGQTETNARQYDLHVRCRVASVVNMDNGVTTALRPSDALGNGIRVAPPKQESLISRSAGIRVDSR